MKIDSNAIVGREKFISMMNSILRPITGVGYEDLPDSIMLYDYFNDEMTYGEACQMAYEAACDLLQNLEDYGEIDMGECMPNNPFVK